jgi:hypothetical protein
MGSNSMVIDPVQQDLVFEGATGRPGHRIGRWRGIRFGRLKIPGREVRLGQK